MTKPNQEAVDLTRPIIGLWNRTPQEVFDIMCDRIRRRTASAQSTSGDVERVIADGNKRGVYDTTKIGPEAAAYFRDRAGMLAGLRDEMSEGYRGWLDDCVSALEKAAGLTAIAAMSTTSVPSNERALREAAQQMVDAWAASNADGMEAAEANLRCALAGEPLTYALGDRRHD